ncbi:MAG: ABC-F family ATP-binding cassette domain-containing protein [Planctomycetota bacterium]
MALIEISGVTKQFGTQIVLDDVSLVLHPGETVGLVGANGAGKTTLFKIMAGIMSADMGMVNTARRAAIGMLAQEPDVDPGRTLHDEVACAFDELLAIEKRLEDVSRRMADATAAGKAIDELMQEYDRLHQLFDAAGGHTFQVRMNEILGGLGFTTAEHNRLVGQLSGGQRCRAALAKLLLQDRELLLLDEPTNHLDIDAVGWLEKFLGTHQGGAVIISHDRYLLDRLCTRIVEVEHRQLSSYPGNYSNYADTKAVQLLTDERQFEKDQAFIKKEEAFIRKHMAGQRTKEAQGRRKRLQRRLASDEFVTEKTKRSRSMRLDFGDARSAPDGTVRCENLAMSFGELRLFSDLSFQVPPGERFAITGPNGSGKTTLLKMLIGEIESDGGCIDVPPSLRVGYYAQQGQHVNPGHTVVEELRAVRPEFSEHDARSYAARFRFFGDDVFKKLGMLSGGEQSRVRLATLILSQPDLMILDEPTNHLDIPSCEALEEALLDFSGTIIVVSHDRYFLDQIAERLLVVRPERQRVYQGNYSDYVEAEEQERSSRQVEAKKKKKPVAGQEKPRQPRSATAQYDHLSVEQLEELVIERETALAQLQASFGDAEVYKDPERLAELREQQEHLERELAEVDRAWQERVEAE